MKKSTKTIGLLIFALVISNNSIAQTLEFKPYVQPYSGNANTEFESAVANSKKRKQAQVKECSYQVQIAHSKITRPSTITDGWHKVYAFDNTNFSYCKSVEVNVINNTIVNYPSDYSEAKITKTYPIYMGKTAVIIGDEYGIIGVYEVYFFD